MANRPEAFMETRGWKLNPAVTLTWNDEPIFVPFAENLCAVTTSDPLLLSSQATTNLPDASAAMAGLGCVASGTAFTMISGCVPWARRGITLMVIVAVRDACDGSETVTSNVSVYG